MDRQQIAWWLWAIGTVIIVMSWFGGVSAVVGWCGFGIALVGSVLSWGVRPPRKSSSKDDDSSRREL
ncbi:MAG: hypothetical protein JNM58_06960 [Xanthomonadaceae bacterium]|nr:hypothetical protein [Xanthomonadaceae bacterium]